MAAVFLGHCVASFSSTHPLEEVGSSSSRSDYRCLEYVAKRLGNLAIWLKFWLPKKKLL